jgi:hypothetical protein
MASVTRDQFKVKSELEAVHIPTGAVVRAYPYINPDDMLQSVKIIRGQAGQPTECGDYAEEVRRVASLLLLERAHQAASDRGLYEAA